MRDRKRNEADRLVAARETLKTVWATLDDNRTIIGDYLDAHTNDVRVALEVALDEIDVALLRLPGVNIAFTYNEGDAQ